MEGMPYITTVILTDLHFLAYHAQLLSTTLENLVSEPQRIRSSGV
jgi:hypothetical protein